MTKFNVWKWEKEPSWLVIRKLHLWEFEIVKISYLYWFVELCAPEWKPPMFSSTYVILYTYTLAHIHSWASPFSKNGNNKPVCIPNLKLCALMLPKFLPKFQYRKENRKYRNSKVMYPKFSKNWPYLLAYTMDCDCSKILNHGLNHGLFLSLIKFLGWK